jgi:nucleotide-binding universal stress UspA family protein
MYRKIVVGYDDSDPSKDALALGKRLSDSTGAQLVVAGIFQFDPIWGGYAPQFAEEEAEFARKVEAAARSAGAEAEAFPSSSAARGLHQLAEEIDADLVVVGPARYGRLGQAVAGSVGVALLHGSPCAVGIAPRGYRERSGQDITAIAVGVDGSSEACIAVEAACELASGTGAKLKLVGVAEPPAIGTGKGGAEGWHELREVIEGVMRDRLSQAREMVPEGIQVEVALVSGEPAEALVQTADAPGTLLMVGSRGYGPLRRVLLGSVSTRLVRSARCPLIVTPRGIHHSDEAPSRAGSGTAS